LAQQIDVLQFLVTGFVFSMFSALIGEKAALRSFVFSKFSALGKFLFFANFQAESQCEIRAD
jgi:hypothetical protein